MKFKVGDIIQRKPQTHFDLHVEYPDKYIIESFYDYIGEPQYCLNNVKGNTFYKWRNVSEIDNDYQLALESVPTLERSEDDKNALKEFKAQQSEAKKGAGQRTDSGKIVLDQCPVGITAAVASVFMVNSKKYGGKYDNNNWRLGMDWSKVLNPLKRHIARWESGEELDAESGMPHLYHAAANIAILIEYAKTYKEGDDRYKQEAVTIDEVQELVKAVMEKRKK